MIKVKDYLAQEAGRGYLSDFESNKILNLVADQLNWVLAPAVANTLTWALQEDGMSESVRHTNRTKPNTRALMVANTILLHARQEK